MSMYTATVIKTGNSYALRIPKQLVVAADLTLGEKVVIGNLEKRKRQDSDKLRSIFKELKAAGAFSSIKDPVSWQRDIRKDRPLPGRD